VLITIDTLRQDHLRAYGYERETAAVISRLAQEGARFDALSPVSWTKPAMASVFTGLHPLRHQAIGLRDSLPQAARTLAEALREVGYDTLGVTANGFSSARFGMDQGFRELVYMADHGHGPFAAADAVNAETFARLDRLRPPFFLYVHYLDPHAPYEGPGWGRPWSGRASAVSIQELDAATFRRRPAELLQRARDQYDAEIVRVSAAVGRLLERLRDAAPLTVLLSDHGEEFEEHGRMGHGQTLHEEVLRVPLIVHWPGQVAPGPRAGQASLLDVAPTLLELAGARSDPIPLDGASLVPRLTPAGEPGGAPVERPFLLHVDYGDSHYLGLRRGPAKLIIGRYPHRKQLFSLDTDPGEQRNRLEDLSPPTGFEGLARELAEANSSALARALARVDGAVDTQTHASMAALGYVDASGPEGERRGVPARVRAPDADPGGLLGWERPERFEACLELTAPGAADQLLSGWHAAEAEGRWSEPQAELLLRRPAGPARAELRVAGRRRERGPARLRVQIEGHEALDEAVPEGAFELTVPVDLPPGAAGTLRLRLARDRAYVPAVSGPAPKPGLPPDHRQLGFFLSRVCLAPGAPRAAAGRGLILLSSREP
jgi:arylsulfatase